MGVLGASYELKTAAAQEIPIWHAQLMAADDAMRLSGAIALGCGEIRLRKKSRPSFCQGSDEP
jgi:hypothetical protein